MSLKKSSREARRKLAARIVAYRQEHGLFTTTEQLLLVEGIGDGLLETLSDHITTGG